MDSENTENPQAAGLIASVVERSLPDSYATRWHPGRKALVVEAVENGTLRLERAMVLYRLSPEEFDTWREAWERKRQRAAAAAAPRARALAFGRKGVMSDDEHPSPSDA